MNKRLKNKYFIILNKDEIIFSCLNCENKITFTKKHALINGSKNLDLELESFFTNNLIKIEKYLKDFIKQVYIIFDTGNILDAHISMKYNFDKELINEQKIKDLLISLKYQFTKYTDDYEIFHMLITKTLINGKEKDLIEINETCKNLILEIRFACLEDQIVNSIRHVLSNYQIYTKKIILANYLREYYHNCTKNIVFMADKIINNYNSKEISWTRKTFVKKGFFEKFFNFFD